MTNYVNFPREFRDAAVDGMPSAELFFRPESPADYKLLNAIASDPLSEAPREQSHSSQKYPAVLEWISEPVPGTTLSRRTLVVRLDTAAPKATPAAEDSTPMPKPLEAMEKPELLEFAAKNNIAVKPEWSLKKLRDEIAHAGASEE